MAVAMSDSNQAIRDPQGALCTVDHVADFNRRYPGDDVSFFTRVLVRQPLSGFTLRITLSNGLVPGRTHAPDSVVPGLSVDDGTSHLMWTVEREIEAGSCLEYQVEARVAPTQQDRALQSRAVIFAEPSARVSPDDVQATSHAEEVTVAVSAKGKYLQYLPAIYQKDELMGRFLMLFESFWNPIEAQIGHLPLYFDPSMTTPELLPWLASWLDLVLDERWPEERRRELIRSAASLFRRRGTRRGLVEYLEIFTGQKVEIVEHRSNNFLLGAGARLGPGIALGTRNIPHTFTVIVPSTQAAEEETGEQARDELERRRILESIIEAQRPVHTRYRLRFETEPSVRGELADQHTSDQIEG